MFKKKDERPYFVFDTYTGKNQEPDFLKKIDAFLEQFNRGDIIFKDAFKIPVSRDNVKTSLGHLLSFQLSNYELVRSDLDSKTRLAIASECLNYINHARIAGVVQETESLTSKLEECKLTNESLKVSIKMLEEEKTEIENKYLKVMKNNEEYEKYINNILPKGKGKR